MLSDLEIILYDRLPENLRSGQDFKSKEKFHSDYFWKNCASRWHENYVHKVYVLVERTSHTGDNGRILGYYSLRANEIEIRDGGEKQFIPIADVAFIDVHEELTEETCAQLFRSLLEHIEHICIKLAKSIGCRYIRCYLPTHPERKSDKIVSGSPLYPLIETQLKEMKYMEPPVKDSNKIRRIRDKSKGAVEVVLKYFIRHLLFTT